jgi:aquaporin Z
MMNKYIVEFLGTMFLVFVIFATGNYLAIGAALAVAVVLGGAISGGAFNPAVAIALMQAGKIPRSDLIPYIIAQVAGALAGFEMYKMIVNRTA